MDARRFDVLTRRLASGQSRRTAAAFVGSLLVAPLLASPSVAKKKKKITLCHQGQTIEASKKKKKKLLKAGASLGACPVLSTPPPPPTGSTTTTTTTPAPTCRDTVRNGDESDVDCGGSCARCGNNQRCDSRNDCASAYCVDNSCQACPGEGQQCGSDGAPPCFCGRDHFSGQLACLNPTPPGVDCTEAGCPTDHVCVPFGMIQFTCLKLCGAA